MTGVESPAYVPGHGLLRGRTAVVTAAAGTGIGAATARRFLEEGARVLISDAHPRRLEKHEREPGREFPGAVTAPPCDVTDDAQVRALFETAAAAHGRLDVVVNNASVLGWRAQAGQAHYAAAKAGVMALTRCAAVEAAAVGVRVDAVAPSLALHPHLEKVTTPGLLAELTGREAFGRPARPWEVANVIVFLASGYSSYLTGEVVAVSGQHA
ncbi:SDR family oxidoreductase [Streptomyces eurythermus]|uniref:SDR family oxidoreductase n=1 Tax=Streptomyces eurythermus TaxID=42237 RepID=UPI0036FE00D0